MVLGSLIGHLDSFTVFDLEEVSAMRQIQNKYSAIACCLGMVKVPAIRVVLLGLVRPLSLAVLFQRKIFIIDALNQVFFANLKDLN